jgi:membrane protease YdiL (CAAX protease family)
MENSVLNVHKADRGRQDSVIRCGGMKPGRHLLAAALGILPIYGFAVLLRLRRDAAYTVGEMLFFPLVVGGMGLLWIALLNRSLCAESLGDLNLRPGKWQRDALGGVMLAAALLVLFYVEQWTINQWLPRRNQDVLNLIRGLARNPILLALWLGPTVWIGIACFEEISRVFLLKRLWFLSGSRSFKWLTVFFSAVLFGCVHLYQGAAGVAGTAIFSLFQGWIYMRFGRVWTLIIAHALYDSAQILWVLSLIWRGLI